MYKRSIFKRMVSLMLSLVMVLSVMPAVRVLAAPQVSEGIISTETQADPYTLNEWTTAFDPYDLTTEHAGGVWTDKSVIAKGDIAAALPGIEGLDVADDNFLVALSALAANSVITGQTTLPTDTIFVLDVSGSMTTTDINAMVEAANDAIHTLLTVNSNNRVGVIAYSNSATAVLPLGRYTPVTKTQTDRWGNVIGTTINYIESGSSRLRPARVGSGSQITYVQNGNGDNMNGNGASLGGGTFIQGGLWLGLEWFQAATDTDNRMPVMVLMSDGAPTWTTNDYNNVDPDDPEYGGGYTSSESDGNAFLTQLTAAYVKEKMAEEYTVNGVAATPWFYTVGLGVSEGWGNSASIAEAVLDTGLSRNTIENYWTTFHGLADDRNKTMTVTGTGSGNTSVTYSSELTAQSQEYVDKYFPAEDASELSSAFQAILNEISLQGGYYVTRLDGAGTHAGGYVTFVDEIGTGMEVKDIKGILIGDHLFTGERLVSALLNSEFGTADEPTLLGDNMVWALKQRLGIEETAVVHDLIRQAYNAGQISYNATTGEYSNYICWFSDAQGDYLGFWDYTDPYYPIPEGAAYANASFGMLGATTDSQTAHASDMMYVAVMVSKQVTEVNGEPAIEAKTPELVTFRVPAALLPTVTYQIDVEAEDDEEITVDTEATITYMRADPIRLLYEVGVHSQLTPENIHEFVREGYQAKDEDGNYYLYTNAWYWEPADGSEADFNEPPTKENEIGKDVLYDPSRNHITYAHFEPGEQNEHYYYTEDTVLYVKNGDRYTPVTGTLDTTGATQYYYPHRTFVSKTVASATNTQVAASVNYHYGEIDSKVLSDPDNYAENEDGQWYIKEGTMRYSIHSHDRDKAENTTGSYFARMHNLINIGLDGSEAYHSELVYLGNNGRVTYSPAQGFTLAKVMVAGAEATGSFSFEITVTGDTDGKVKLDGVEQALAGGKLTVMLKAGEEVTVTGIDVGATYTVTELDRDGYKLGSILSSSTTASVNGASVSDTVAENAIPTVTYTNDLQYYGNLLLSKDVTYNKDSRPATANTQEFTVKVTLTGLGGAQVFVNGTPETLEADGSLTLTLKDGEQALVTGIPEGTAYTVEEDDTLPKGYAITEGSFSGTIVRNETAQAAVKNEYTPDDVVLNNVEPAISLDVTKRLDLDIDTSDDSNSSYKIGEYDFLFLLQRYNVSTGDWDTLSDDTAITINNPAEPNSPFYGEGNIETIPINLEGIAFDSVGSYYFRVKEDIPANLNAGWTYDRTHHDFVVVVTDADLDGYLEISEVRSLQHAYVPDPTDRNNDGVAEYWNVSTEFTNEYAAKSTKLTIEALKTLTGATLADGQFEFALYETSENYDITGITPKTAKNGAKGEIIFPTITYPFVNGSQYHYYVMKETSTDGNGITVDKTAWEIRVKVTGGDNGEAAVETVEWRKQGDTNYSSASTFMDNVFSSITFENTYTPESVKQEITANKTLTNLTPGAQNASMVVPAGKFSFTLSAVTADAPMPESPTVSASQGGAVTFGQIEFTKAGTYVYKLVENDTNVPGVTYDASEYTVTVVVTDNGTGNLVSSVTYTKDGVNGSATFANTYKAEPATGIVLQGKKVLSVDTNKYTRPLKAGEFHFTLSGDGIAPETVSNKADGTFAFSPLSFDAVGEYEYSIQEVGAGSTANGVAYDSTTKMVTIVVEDNSAGQLVAKVGGTAITTYNFGSFTNTYTATSATVQIKGYKELMGRELAENEFSFTLSGNGMTPETVKNDADGNITFSALSFDKLGTYEYTVVEEKLDENGDPIVPDADGNYIYKGVNYAQISYIVTVTVTDNGLGTLTASMKIVDNNGVENPVRFINSYSAAPVDAEITATKELYDLTGGANNQLTVPADTYKFKLEALEGAPMPADAVSGVKEVFAAAGGAISFGDIEFTAEGTYSYRLTENDLGLDYLECDPSVYIVEVEIEDDLQGELKVKEIRYTLGGTDRGSAVFTNKYAAEAITAGITASKKLTNTTPGVTDTVMTVPANTYKFKLERITANAPMPAEAEVFAAAGGAVTFGRITYTTAGVYAYSLNEIDMNVAGVTTDDTVYTVIVTVKDNGQGALYVESITYNGAATAPEFENEYLAKPVQIHVEGDSTVTGGKIFNDETSLPGNKKDLDDYEFHFTLAQLDGTEIETVSDNGAGFEFQKLSFDTIGTYQYMIYERPDNDAGVTYDYAKYRVTVTVTDADLDGQLEASVKYEKASAGESDDYQTVSGVVFENTYKAKKTAVTFAGKKVLEGGRKLKGNDFSFILSDENGEIETVKNDANGDFAFTAIEYTTEGTRVYTLKEKNDGVDNIEYDGTEYTITVTVTDVNGELKATTVVATEEGVVNSYGFTNIYTPENVGTSITVQKVLKNESDETMGLSGFTFQLELDGAVKTLTSGADGKVAFELSFGAADVGETYTYKLSEIKGNVNGMTYDETVYEIVIAVTQNDEGELELTVTREGTGDFTFENTYVPEPDEIPKTGVTVDGGWTLMMAVGAICGLAVLVLGKKKLLAE